MSRSAAFLSDVHGNLPALEAVLADIDARGIDEIYFLGDVLGKGPSVHEVLDLLLSLIHISPPMPCSAFALVCPCNLKI